MPTPRRITQLALRQLVRIFVALVVVAGLWLVIVAVWHLGPAAVIGFAVLLLVIALAPLPRRAA